jgi:crotonobetainyl-CoA:carnitine CoA-transferase CaiB-like acyl-CoA transferase
LTDPRYATPKARLPHLSEIFDGIEEWTKTKTKFEAMDILNEHDIPCGPILSMKEIAEEPSLRKTGTVVEVDHPTRGKYLTVGNPIKMSDSPSDVNVRHCSASTLTRSWQNSASERTRSQPCAPTKSSETNQNSCE